ncbi:hypothetical protein AB0I13_32730 [Streptomyces prasinus]
MTNRVNVCCDQHDNPFACPDALVDFSPRFQEYGLIIHDGGTSSITIDFCPWCGRRLPESLRDRWFDELERRGIDPWGDEVPAEFQDGRWLVSLRQELRPDPPSRPWEAGRQPARTSASSAGRGPYDTSVKPGAAGPGAG